MSDVLWNIAIIIGILGVVILVVLPVGAVLAYALMAALRWWLDHTAGHVVDWYDRKRGKL